MAHGETVTVVCPICKQDVKGTLSPDRKLVKLPLHSNHPGGLWRPSEACAGGKCSVVAPWSRA